MRLAAFLGVTIATLCASSAAADVVVMRNGTVHVGTVTESDGGVTIETDRGPVLAAAANVQAHAETLPAAFEQLRKVMTTEPQRMALGRWCLEHRLISQAEEVFATLNTDLRAEAMERVRKSVDELSEPSKSARPRRDAFADLTLKPSTRPTDTVARRVAAQYGVRIRPLLQNGCGAAGCHGAASDQDLRLLRGNRLVERQTVEDLLRRIDRDRPEESDLLHYAATPHGGATQIATDPVRHPERFARLRAWVVETAAADRFGGDPARRASVGWKNGALQVAE